MPQIAKELQRSLDDISAASLEAPAVNNGNVLLDWLGALHSDEDLAFLLGGITRLLNNPQIQTWLPNSYKVVTMFPGSVPFL